jgi:hypothetical protein
MPPSPIPIIINPAARSTKAAARVDQIRALKPAPDLHFTTASGDAMLLAEQLARQGHPLIVAAGGDGTAKTSKNDRNLFELAGITHQYYSGIDDHCWCVIHLSIGCSKWRQ